MSYVISVLAILVAVGWVCLALPTTKDRQNEIDRIETTGKGGSKWSGKVWP